MIIERKIVFLKIARVILDTRGFLNLLQACKHHFISAILYDRPPEAEKYFQKEKKTPIINLKPDIDTIFSKFNDTARNEIRRSSNILELEFRTSDKDVKSIYKFHAEFE